MNDINDPCHSGLNRDAVVPAKQILCVWLPNWPIQRIQASEPALANRPLVLTSRDPRRGVVVAAANLTARRAGVRPAMRLAEATALTELEIRTLEPDEDLESLRSLAEQAQQFSPLVGLEQLDRRTWAGRWLHQPECLLLDITGLPGLFGGPANMLRQIGGWLHKQHYFGCLAVGSSVGAAWALACYALRHDARPAPESTDPQSSKPGTAKPESPVPESRYLFLDPDQQLQQLHQLPLAALRIDDSTVHTLRRLGLSRIGQLANLPRAGLASRLGQQLLNRWDQACGYSEEAIVSVHQLPEWSVEQELELPTDHIPTIEELVRRAICQLAMRLEKGGKGALRLVCRLDLVQKTPLVFQLGLFRPTCDSQHLTMLMTSQMEHLLPSQMQAPLWRLSLAASLIAPLVWRQSDLFQADQAVNRHEMARLVDTLSARLGRKQVLRAQVHRQSQPELAYTLSPLTGLKPDGQPRDTLRKLSSRQALQAAEPMPEDPLRRPTLLLPNPTPIEVAGRWLSSPTPQSQSLLLTQQPATDSARSTGQAAAPARIKTTNGWHEVMAACGPERLESGWWKAASCRRDYYRIITHLGCWWWIYRDLSTGKWYLHGIFD